LKHYGAFKHDLNVGLSLTWIFMICSKTLGLKML